MNRTDSATRLICTLLLLLLGPRPTVAEEFEAPASPFEVPELVKIQCIPFSELDSAMLDERSMMVPYRELVSLIRRASQQNQEASHLPSYIVRKARYRGRVEDRVVRMGAELHIQVLSSNWSSVNLDFGQALVSELRLDGSSWPAITDGPSKLSIPIRGPSEHRLEVDLFVPINVHNGMSRIEFSGPRTASTPIEVTLPNDATFLPASSSAGTKFARSSSDDPVVSSFLPPTGSLRIGFRESASRRESPPVQVRTRSTFNISEAVATSRIDIEITGAAFSTPIGLSFPASAELLRLHSDDGLRENESVTDGKRTIRFTPTNPPNRPTRLTLELQTPLTRLPSPIELPFVEVAGEDRHQGTATATVEPGIRMRNEEMSGVLLSALTKNRTTSNPTNDHSFEFLLVRPPFRVAATIHRTKPRRSAEIEADCSIHEHRITQRTSIRISATTDPLYEISVPVPREWEVLDVRAENPKSPLKWELASGSPARALRIQFAAPIRARSENPSSGNARRDPKQTIVIETEKKTTGASRIEELSPLVPIEADDIRGHLLLSVATTLLVTDAGGEHMTRIPPVTRPQHDAYSTATQRLAFRFEDLPATARILVEPSVPRVTARVNVLHTPTSQALLTTADLIYRIDGGSRDRFRFRIPEGYVSRVDVAVLAPAGMKIKEKTSDDTHSLWTVLLQEKASGEIRLRVSIEKALPADVIRGAAPVELRPFIHGLDVLAEEGHVGIATDDRVEIRITTNDLREIDVADLMFPLGIPSVPLLFAYRTSFVDYDLRLKLKVHRPGSVASCIVESVTHHLNLSEDGALRAKCILRIKNGGRQHIGVLLPAGSVHWSTLLDGQPVKTLASENGLLVPIPRSPDETSSQVVEITYAANRPPMRISGELDLEYPLIDAPVLSTHGFIDLPGEFHYLADPASTFPPSLPDESPPPFLSWLVSAFGTVGESVTRPLDSASDTSRVGVTHRADSETEQLRSLGYVAGKNVIQDEEVKRGLEADKAPARKRGVLPMNIALLSSGQVVRFDGYGDGGATKLRYTSRELLRTRAMLLLALGLVAAFVLDRRRWLPVPFQCFTIWPALLAGPYLLPSPWSQELNAIFCGFLGIGIIALSQRLVKAVRNALFLHHPQEIARWTSSLPLVLLATSAPILLGHRSSIADEPPPPANQITIPYDPDVGFPSPDSQSPTFLPISLYEALTRKAYPELSSAHRPSEIENAIFSQSYYDGEFAGDHVRLHARIHVYLFEDRTSEVSLFLGEAILLKGQVDGEPGAIFRDPVQNHFRVTLFSRGSHEILLELDLPVATADGRRFAAITLPRCPASHLRLRVPKELAPPLIGPEPLLLTTSHSGAETVLSAALGDRSRLEIDLPASVNRTRELQYRLRADAHVDLDAVTVQFHWTADSAAAPTVWHLAVPSPLRITNVSSDSLRSMEESQHDGERILTLTMAPDPKRPQSLRLEGFQKHRGESMDLPVVRLEGATLIEGALTLRSHPHVVVRAEAPRGLARTNAVRADPETEAFRILQPSFSVRLESGRPTEELNATIEALVTADSTTADVRQRCVLDSRGKIGNLHAIRVPVGFDIIRVSCPDLIDSWETNESEERLLWIRADGSGGTHREIGLHMRGPVIPGSPTRLPLAFPESATHIRGKAIFRTEPDTTISLEASPSIQDESTSAFKPMARALLELFPASEPEQQRVDRRAFSFRGDPGDRITWIHLPPRIESEAVTTATFHDGWFDLVSTLTFRPAQGQTDRVTLSVPEETAALFEVSGEPVASVHKRPAIGDRSEIDVILHRKESKPFSFTVSSRFGWKHGESIRIPVIRPKGVARSSAQVILLRELEAELRIVDRRGLVLNKEASDATRTVFRVPDETDDPWSLVVTAEPVRAAEVLEAAINSMTLETFAFDTQGRGGGALLTRLELRIENRTEPFLRLRMPRGADLWSVIVDHTPSKPIDPTKRREKDRRKSSRTRSRLAQKNQHGKIIWVPLKKSSPGETASIVEVIYYQSFAEPLHEIGKIDPGAPEVLNMPVSQTYWRILLPANRTATVDGNLEEIAEAVALVDRLEALLDEQNQLRTVAEEGTHAQQLRARTNLFRNEFEVRKTQSQAYSAQQLLMTESQQAGQKGHFWSKEKTRNFRNQLQSNALRLDELQKKISAPPGVPPPTETVEELAEEEVFDGDTGKLLEQSRAKLEKQQSGFSRRSPTATSDVPKDAPAPKAFGKGLLSLAIELPPATSEMLFKKLEGDPELTFQIKYHKTTFSWIGFFVFVGLLLVATAVIRLRTMST